MVSIGIDISSNIITAVELISSRNNIQIKNSVNFEISPEAIEKGELQESGALTQGLREAWKKFKISARSVNIGLSNLKAIVREIELPLVDDDEIRNSLQYQINDFIPIPKDNILYDFYIIQRDKSTSKIMLAGAMKSMVKNVIDSIKEAGLIAQTVDLNCFSLFRTIERAYGIKSNKNIICAVNIGRDVSIIEIIENDTLKFPRFISNSVTTFISNIAKSADMDLDSAANAVNNFDFGSLCNESDKQHGKETDKDINSIRMTADSFIEEIKLSIEHYLQEDPIDKIEKILISGEELKNINKYISYKTDYKVERLDISSSFSLDLIKNSSAYKDSKAGQILNPLAIGMALRGLK